jgi:hypothetical protein
MQLEKKYCMKCIRRSFLLAGTEKQTCKFAWNEGHGFWFCTFCRQTGALKGKHVQRSWFARSIVVLKMRKYLNLKKQFPFILAVVAFSKFDWVVSKFIQFINTLRS